MSDEKNRLNSSSFAPEYPYNKVMVTEGGHEVHYDDTPGKERIRVAHKDGTYDEISVGGKRVSYTVGQNQQYNKSGLTLTVDENHDVKVSGHQVERIGGGKHSEIAGESSLVVGSGINVVCLGDAKIAVGGSAYIGTSGDINLNSGGSMSMDIAGDLAMNIKGSIGIHGSSISTNSDGATNISAGGDVVTKGSSTKIQGGGASAPPTTFR